MKVEKKESYRSNGKLLLTGEYLILEGAHGLALPLKLGQTLDVYENKENNLLIWRALVKGSVWFESKFEPGSLLTVESSDNGLSEKLRNILSEAKNLNPDIDFKNKFIETNLEFDTGFGFGSSSTLIINIARWLNVDPYELQKRTFKGSGYDIACGMSDTPVVYFLKNGKPVVEKVAFNPVFKENLFFVYLGKKQKSSEEVSKFKRKKNFTENDIKLISAITGKVLQTSSLNNFEELVEEHEKIMSRILETATVKEKYFKGYEGAVKSLGAWGGDFVLVTSKKPFDDLKTEMKARGFDVVFKYDELVL